MEILIAIDLIAILAALILIAIEVRKVSEQVGTVAKMEEDTQKLLL